MPARGKGKWRFIGIATSDGASNMAIDEAILHARAKDMVPNTIRLYKWAPPAVSTGYFLKVNEVVDVDACEKYGIDVVRRISGGGAVYHSENEVTYSVFVREDDSVVPKDVTEVYRKLSSALMSVPCEFGLKPVFEAGHPGVCPYMAVAGRKISGSAQARKRGVILQHGTLLLDCDLEIMSKVLRLPPSLVDARVTTLRKELDRQNVRNSEMVKDAGWIQSMLREGFAECLGVELVDGHLTEFETCRAQELRVKYVSSEWTKLR